MGEAAVEHGQIVVVIAGGEDVFAFDADEARRAHRGPCLCCTASWQKRR
jgi:hypothetical protein